MKRFGWLMVGALALGLTACGPANFEGSDPTAPDSLIDRDGDAPIDFTQYEWVSYEFIVSVFVDVLGQNFGGPTDSPETNPLAYLEARKSQVGAANYDDIVDQAQTGTITAPGYKTLIFSGVSACGLAMENAGTQANLFPGLVAGQPVTGSMLDNLYLTLISRYPTDEERAIHETMWNDMASAWQAGLDAETANPGTLDPSDLAKYQAAVGSIDQANARKTAASCGVLVTSMEFLTIN